MYKARTLEIPTKGRGIYDITETVQNVVADSGLQHGLCTVFIHHTSASLLISENADPQVLRDLEAFFARLVPDGDWLYQHVAEGPDDMPSHVRAALTQTSLGIPIEHGRCALGTWQAVYVYEHRRASHRRKVTVAIVGE